MGKGKERKKVENEKMVAEKEGLEEERVVVMCVHLCDSLGDGLVAGLLRDRWFPSRMYIGYC